MCEVFGIPRSSFYARQVRTDGKRAKEDAALLTSIKAVHKTKRKVYGAPRIHRELQSQGISVGRKRIANIMRKNGIASKVQKKYKVTTNSEHSLPVAPNLLQQDFSAKAPNEVWTGDITYIRTREGWLYLAVVLDLYSRKVIGWSMGKRMTAWLVISAFVMAVNSRSGQYPKIFHSDRGSQYASSAFRDALTGKVRQSMSGKGNCYDNAVTESFFHTLKSECVVFEQYETRDKARSSIFEYIEAFYNRDRLHSTLGYLSPERFEKMALAS